MRPIELRSLSANDTVSRFTSETRLAALAEALVFPREGSLAAAHPRRLGGVGQELVLPAVQPAQHGERLRAVTMAPPRCRADTPIALSRHSRVGHGAERDGAGPDLGRLGVGALVRLEGGGRARQLEEEPAVHLAVLDALAARRRARPPLAHHEASRRRAAGAVSKRTVSETKK